jgi:hypothetical protein
MRKRQPPEEQASLFDLAGTRKPKPDAARSTPTTKPGRDGSRTWRMPEVQGCTVAEIRVRWTKRLTPAQVAHVEAELGALPKSLTKLGFGTVQVEHAFVRRRRT